MLQHKGMWTSKRFSTSCVPARGRTALFSFRHNAGLCLALALALSVGNTGCSKSERREGTVQPSQPKNEAKGEQNARQAVPNEVVPDAEVLLAAHVEAAGGLTAIQSIHSIYSEATLNVKAQSLKGKIKSWWKDGRFFIEESVEGVGRTRAGFDGKRYWSDDPISQLRELEGAEAEQYAWASSMFLPAHWKKHFVSAKSIGARKVGSEVLYDVELRTKGGEKLVMSFDKASKLMREQSFEQISAMGKIPLTVRLSDYREVGGYKFPHRQELVTPILNGVQTYDIFKVNPDVNEELFSMPLEHDLVPADPSKQKIAAPGRRK